MDELKGVITNEERTINPKNRPIRVIPNCIGFIILSNHEQVLTLGANFRRFIVCMVDNKYALRTQENLEYFKNLHKIIEERGAAQFLYFLLNLDLKGWHPREIIDTQEGEELRIASLTGIYAYLYHVIETGVIELDNGTITRRLNQQGDVINERVERYHLKDNEEIFVPTDHLYKAAQQWGKENNKRMTTNNKGGNDFTAVFGERVRGSADPNNRNIRRWEIMCYQPSS
jgi:hypothetical protein